jgi:Xaa-Pro aminopeptidase
VRLGSSISVSPTCNFYSNFSDGTTDVTRTIHLGRPTERERLAFTLVLKGHIALARAVFPEGTSGTLLPFILPPQPTCFAPHVHSHSTHTAHRRLTLGLSLDILARLPLYERGLDYRHGTGHGVGSCLNVHEGPAGISKRASAMVPLKRGMIITNGERVHAG